MSRASTVLCHAVASALLFSASTASAFPPAGAARLTLAAQFREGKGRRDWSASATLVLPFDRFWAPRFAGSLAEPPDTSEAPDDPDTRIEAEPTRPPAPDRPLPRAERPPRPRRPAALGASFVRAVVAAALRARGYGSAATRRLDSLAARSRSSAALPSLWLRAARSTDASLRLSPTLSEPDRYTETGGADLWLEAKLSWNLDRLLFAPNELAVERIRDQRAAARARLVLQVLDAVFNWHRARLRARDATLLPEERFESTLEQLEAELTLDVLTGGWFSERAGDPRARQGGGP